MPTRKSATITRDYHPATVTRYSPGKGGKGMARPKSPAKIKIPKNREGLELEVDGKVVKLTNLPKLFWPELGITKRDLIQYYADVSPYLLPHLHDRAMVMKRYPQGAAGEFFFMKRAPSPRPDWIELCSIEHSSGNVIDFPMIQDLPALLWVINLGCIDLNQWYATCDDVDLPDYVHFDLDPVKGATFAQVREAALILKATLDSLKMPSYPKTTGSRGIHVYVPIVRGPTPKDVWTVAKTISISLAGSHPRLLTAEYRVARRPSEHVLVDYNQNAWGRTLASVYSVRPHPAAAVSTPVEWSEIVRGLAIEDFRIDNVPARVAERGDLWAPLYDRRGRFKLEGLA